MSLSWTAIITLGGWPLEDTRLQCPDCGHERLIAFTCKGRHFCPSCHQRRVRSTSDWIATAVCHEVPHRQFVFAIPKVLRGIFRKRRQLLSHLFLTATEIVTLPRPPPPPFDIHTMEPIEPPSLAIKEWIPDDEPNLDWFNRPRNPSNPDPEGFDQRPGWQPAELRLDDGRILVLDEF